MSYEEFWYGDPWLAYYYKKAYIERRKAENYRDWLLGAYFYNAIGTALANGFAKKGARKQNYLSEPFPIFPPTAEEKKARADAERERSMQALRAMQKSQRAKKEAREKKHAENNNSGAGSSPEDAGTNERAEGTGERPAGTV